eukprot:jgi/Bigna1/145906/aug1.105_g20614
MSRRNQRRHEKKFGSDLEISFKSICASNHGGSGSEGDESITGNDDDDGLDCSAASSEGAKSVSVDDDHEQSDDHCEVSSVSSGGEDEVVHRDVQQADDRHLLRANPAQQAGGGQDHVRLAEILDVEEEDDTVHESHDGFWRKNFAG